ncbi:MFS general substrate transporter [Mollisia scopiformis]|uniref:MFS general substrate transporter n=1 Tax=Mollisia scopiformis TaxID=149040 RepID=A0A194X786_MOLSC|nr:MFS general substrate transporter [Mollisia scopiformis]KUJ15944.1 MFS general substrate transporter [Mollisia scopiformis]
MSTTVNGHASRGEAVLVVTTTTFVLATVFVVSRLFIAFGLSFTIDYATSKGLGRHDVDIPASWQSALRRSEYAFTILYNPALMATKTSILIFYLRLSKNTQNVLRIASYVTLAVVNVAGVVLTFMNAFQCSPVSAAYDPAQTSNQCISITTLYLCSAPVNIITDLAILVLPIPVLTGVRLPQRQKTILVFTFALGVFVTIVDVIRIYYLQQAVDNQVVAHQQLGTGTDFAWNASTALMWSAVEVNVGIICACIPTLKPLIKRILPSLITDRIGSGTATDKTISFSSQVQGGSGNSHQMDPVAAPVPSLPPAHEGADPEAEMDMMDFLTTPGMQPGTMNRSETVHTQNTDNTVYFGFVNMRRPKSMLKTKDMESFKYCTIVTILFFLWGFSYGLLNTLNDEIANIAGESTAERLGLSTAYFGAYLFGGLTIGQWVLRKAGFKATFIVGLCIYGTGTLMFWPSAVLTSFPGFILSNFVAGLGLSILEAAANPFIALCGPSYHSEFRLLLAQGVQAIASILSQLLAQDVLFAAIGPDNVGLLDVQWAYLAIALFTVILALFFYYMPLPEATDADLQQQSEDLGIYKAQTILRGKLPLIYTTLALAIFTNFVYVGGQEALSVWFGALLDSVEVKDGGGLTLSVDNYTLVGHATFAFGRFFFAFLCLIIAPRILLLVSFIGCIIFACLTMSLSSGANSVAGPALVFFFFEGPIFPLVYAIGLRGLGSFTKWGASILTAATSGGAVFTWVMFAVQNLDKKSVEHSYCVIVALYAFGILYPIYLNFVPMARHQVDPSKDDHGLPIGDRRRSSSGRDSPIRRFSRRFSTIFEMIKVPKGGRESEDGFVEHRERRGSKN